MSKPDSHPNFKEMSQQDVCRYIYEYVEQRVSIGHVFQQYESEFKDMVLYKLLDLVEKYNPDRAGFSTYAYNVCRTERQKLVNKKMKEQNVSLSLVYDEALSKMDDDTQQDFVESVAEKVKKWATKDELTFIDLRFKQNLRYRDITEKTGWSQSKISGLRESLYRFKQIPEVLEIIKGERVAQEERVA
jgi:DNA-directed RNA polymerase specialized sigma subunit